jgi:hypothetical protein
MSPTRRRRAADGPSRACRDDCNESWPTPHFFRRFVERNPIAPLHLETVALQGRVVSDHDAVARGVQFDDVKRFGRGKPKPFALADGEKLNAVVLAQDLPAHIDNVAAMPLTSLAAERNLP